MHKYVGMSTRLIDIDGNWKLLVCFFISQFLLCIPPEKEKETRCEKKRQNGNTDREIFNKHQRSERHKEAQK